MLVPLAVRLFLYEGNISARWDLALFYPLSVRYFMRSRHLHRMFLDVIFLTHHNQFRLTVIFVANNRSHKIRESLDDNLHSDAYVGNLYV